MTSIVSAIWRRDDAAARFARAMLRPAERIFAAAVDRRNSRYDRAVLVAPALPALSIGNLTVGGTGKTPMAAWCVQRLIEHGASPAIVLRGYGDDEWRVHSLLNPGVPVIVSPDRIAGIATARTRGADSVVLDDAFQHRRAARIADLVLLSADEWTERVRLLPAGPYREPLSALVRATVVVITAKAAGFDAVQAVSDAVTAAAPSVPISVIGLRPVALRLVSSLVIEDAARETAAGDAPGEADSRPVSWLAGRRVVAASAIGNPAAFESQIRALRADIVHGVRFADHHAFSASDARRIAFLADGTDGAVCTLKDAVKLRSVWPRQGPPLWYVSQSVVVDRGAEALDRAIARVLAARTATRLSPPA